MPVDLSDYLDNLKREVNPPGTNLFPEATDTEYAGHLTDAFWEARLDGMLSDWTESDGVIASVTDGGGDISRDLVQLVILYAGIRIVRNHLRNIRTAFRAKAGSTEYETQQSAQLLRDILDELRQKRSLVLQRLSDLGKIDSYVLDALYERDYSIRRGDTDWWR